MRIVLFLLVGLAALLAVLLFEPEGTPDAGAGGPTGPSSMNQEAAESGEGAVADASLARREEVGSERAESGERDFGNAPLADIVVVDSETGDPVPGAQVLSRDPEFDFFAQPVARQTELSLLQHQDFEAHLLAVGTETRTDRRGRCRVPVLHWGTQVCARLGDRWGVLNVGADEPQRQGDGGAGPLELAIGPDHTLHVRVEDPAGQPVVGHKVQVCRDDRSDMYAPITVRRTDADGRCSFPHTQLWSVKGSATGFVRAWLPGGAGEELAIDFLNPPREEVVLIASAPGSIVVRLLDGNGAPVDPAYLPITERDRGAPSLRVYSFDERPPNLKRLPIRRQWPIEIGEGGVGRLDSVALNRFFAVVVPNSRRGPVLFEGPTRPDQAVTVDVAMDPGMVVLTGRLFAGDEPVSRERVELIGNQGGGNIWEQARTDAEGRFFIRLASSYAGRTGQVLELHRGPRTTRAREQVALREMTFRAGVTDLGVLHFLPPRDLIRGRVVYGEGVARVRPQISSERFAGERWAYQLFATPEWGGDDTFAFRGSAPDGTRFRLRVQTTDALPIDPIEVQVGSGEVTIHLRAAARFRATFLVDEATPVSSLRVRLGVPGGSFRNLQRVPDPEDGSPSVTVAFAEWVGLEPGTGLLEVAAPNANRFLFERQITVPPGESEGPRDLDLRGLVRQLDIQIRAADGKSLEGVRVLAPQAASKSSLYGSHVRGSQVSRVVNAGNDVSILVMAQGYAPRRVVVPAGRSPVEVALQPAPKLIVNTVLPITLPQGAKVSLHLEPAGKIGRSRGGWRGGNGPLSYWLGDTLDVDVGGVAIVRRWVDEPYTIHGEIDGERFSGDADSQLIPAGATTFTFTADAESLRKALERR